MVGKLLITILSLLLLSPPLGAQPTSADSACSSSFHLLEADLLSRPQNRLHLTTKFFPPRDANPVIIKVNYNYDGSNITDVWFWSESEFYFIQPLEIFLYTSLFFANQPYRQSTLTLELSADCLDSSKLHMKLLTQRVSSSVTCSVARYSVHVTEHDNFVFFYTNFAVILAKYRIMVVMIILSLSCTYIHI